MPRKIRNVVNSKNLNIRINPELLATVNLVAKTLNQKSSKWIRDALIIRLQDEHGYPLDQLCPLIEPMVLITDTGDGYKKNSNKTAKRLANNQKKSSIEDLDFLS